MRGAREWSPRRQLERRKQMTKWMITIAVALAAAQGPALASERASAKRGYYALSGTDAVPMSSGGTRGFAGWPTDYNTNRFGDRQLQGR